MAMAPLAAFLRRMLLPLVLGTLGTALLHARFGAKDQVQNLLHPLLHPLVAGSGFLLLAAALAFLLFPPERPRSALKTGRDAVLALVFVLVLAMAPDSFSALALANRASADPSALLKGKADEEEAPAWTPDTTGAIPLEITDLFMAVGMPKSVAALEGKKVRLIGQASGEGASLHLVRFIMFCCAADAQPVSLPVEGENGAGLGTMAWTEAVGTVHFRQAADGKKQEPVLALESAKAIPQPKDKFIY